MTAPWLFAIALAIVSTGFVLYQFLEIQKLRSKLASSPAYFELGPICPACGNCWYPDTKRRAA